MITEVERIRNAICHIPADDRSIWVMVGMAVKSELGDAGYEIWDAWSQQAESYKPQSALSVWRSFKGGKTTIASLFKAAIDHGWRDDQPYTPPDPAIAAARHKKLAEEIARDEELKRKRQEQAARVAAKMLRQCHQNTHAYLDSKGFPELKGNVLDGQSGPLLLIPMSVDHQLVGCQAIDIDGVKKFIPGQRAKGAEFVINNKGQHWWCEGWATALSLQAALNAIKLRYTIHVCFSAGNLEYLAKSAGVGTVFADNDASGTGEKAAIATGLPWMKPDHIGDANDMHKSMGIFRFSQWLRGQLQKQ